VSASNFWRSFDLFVAILKQCWVKVLYLLTIIDRRLKLLVGRSSELRLKC